MALQVYVRHEMEADGDKLGDFDVHELPDLVEAFRVHGCYYRTNDDQAGVYHELVTQFEYPPSAGNPPKFEIILLGPAE